MNATLAATMDSHDEGLFHVYERLLILLLDNKDVICTSSSSSFSRVIM